MNGDWDYITVDESTPILHHPKGKDRGGQHLRGNDFKFGRSRNHRRIFRLTDLNGILQTYRIFARKSVKMNRLPRGSKQPIW